MSISRRKFLKGLLATAVAVALPIKAIAELLPKPKVPKMLTAYFRGPGRDFNINPIEDEWANMMAEEIQREIDNELINKINRQRRLV